MVLSARVLPRVMVMVMVLSPQELPLALLPALASGRFGCREAVCSPQDTTRSEAR